MLFRHTKHLNHEAFWLSSSTAAAAAAAAPFLLRRGGHFSE